MPVYEYLCQACAHRFEKKQSFSDEPVRVCPECGGATRKLLSRPGIVFKGSGWYVTDSRPSPPSESSSSPSPETKVETKSETKTDGKKD